MAIDISGIFGGRRDAKNEPQPNAAEVFIYSTPECQYCNGAKSYLLSKGVKFTDYNVSKDQQKAREMFSMTNQGSVPVLLINGRIVVGFDRRLIDDALSKKKLPKRDQTMQNLFFDPMGDL